MRWTAHIYHEQNNVWFPDTSFFSSKSSTSFFLFSKWHHDTPCGWRQSPMSHLLSPPQKPVWRVINPVLTIYLESAGTFYSLTFIALISPRHWHPTLDHISTFWSRYFYSCHLTNLIYTVIKVLFFEHTPDVIILLLKVIQGLLALRLNSKHFISVYLFLHDLLPLYSSFLSLCVSLNTFLFLEGAILLVFIVFETYPNSSQIVSPLY